MDYVIASVENMKEAIKVRSAVLVYMDVPRKLKVLLERLCFVGHPLHAPFCGVPKRETGR